MNIKFLPTLALAVSYTVLAACSASSSDSATTETSTSGDNKTETASSSELEDARAREGALGDMVLGNPDADVTLVEYASFTCGHCASFHKTVYPQIKEKYIDSGKIRFVFRELPTPPHDLSYIGSVIARCAADKGGDKAYFAIADGLFKRQLQWAFGEDPKLELLKISNQAGMDEPALDACLKRQEIVDVINENVKEANEVYKVTGTPSFVLNGEKLTLRTLNDLDTAIAEAIGEPVDAEEPTEPSEE